MALNIDLQPIQPVGKSADKDSESPFQIDELFFSRTDERGVIQAFNSVFSRIAEHDGDTLHGAPHKIIRHPDMPKAVFWLLWDTLKAGKPVSGYVKNRSKSGKYYWVYAIMAPIEGGYLSVRLKPTSPMLGTVADVYKKILRHERESDVSPEQSAALFLRDLRAQGFDDYVAFQAHALVAEFKAREQALFRTPSSALAKALQVAQAQRGICERIASIKSELAEGALYILNMKLKATKLGRDRAAIDAIANNYDLILADIKGGIMRLEAIMADAAASDFRQSKDSLILLCASSIMTEVMQSFEKSEHQIHEAERIRESTVLRSVHETYLEESDAAVSLMMDQCHQVLRRMDSLRQTLLGLSAVRVSLRVETRRLGEKASGLESLISDIDLSHARVQQSLEHVFDIANDLNSAIATP